MVIEYLLLQLGNNMLANISNFVLKKLIPFIVSLTGVKKDSWDLEKYNIVLQSLVMIPFKRLRGVRRNVKSVERQYDELSGLYIKHNYYEGQERYSVVNGGIKKISSIDNVKEIRQEINDILKKYRFKTILEVGIGELTTIEAIYSEFGPDIDCFGIDLSFNRVYHGLSEFRRRHEKIPKIAKADAIKLPLPDNSIDLVFTRHTLEQMPLVFQKALSEISRVAKSSVVLFEPSYELGSFPQKLKMINYDYVRGIPKYLKKTPGVELNEMYLMRNSANPLNHTACFEITIYNESNNKRLSDRPIDFVCPVSHAMLEKREGYLYCKESSLAYALLEGIPNLDPQYSIYMTEPESYE